MNYDFPVIKTLDDVLPHIEGRPEFVVSERNEFICVDYVYLTPDTFTSDVSNIGEKIRRECRGLIFDPISKRIVARRLHKFFNLNERVETEYANLDFTRPHRIIEKLDGSLVTPVLTPTGKMRWATKLGLSDVALEAEQWVRNHDHYVEFCSDLFDSGWTPIFEWCDKNLSIVVKHPKSRLVLIAIRDTTTGKYMNWDIASTVAVAHEIDCAATLHLNDNGQFTSFDEKILEDIRAQSGSEGWVVRFDTGHMIKVKSEWYVNLHRYKSALSDERYLVRDILEDRIDDLKPFMTEEDRVKIDDYIEMFRVSIAHYYKHCEEFVANLKAHGYGAKEFAIEYPVVMNPLTRSVCLRLFNGHETLGWIVERIEGSLTTRKKFGKVKDVVFPHCEWTSGMFAKDI